MSIRIRNIHADEKSYEEETGTSKLKYKLCLRTFESNPDCDGAIFVVTTKDNYYPTSRRTIVIDKNCWVDRQTIPKYSRFYDNDTVVYLLGKNFEYHAQNILDSKISDIENGLSLICRAPAEVYEKLLTTCADIESGRINVKDEDMKEMISSVLPEIKITKRFLKKLGI